MAHDDGMATPDFDNIKRCWIGLQHLYREGFESLTCTTRAMTTSLSWL
jgi:hypothetical protein